MSKTADLRKLITSLLNTIEGQTYYRTASKNAKHPYKVFDLTRINLEDSTRDDLELTVDLWDLVNNPKRVDSIADEIEEIFNVANLPQDTILPTFFRSGRYPIEDSDKDIQHLQLTFQVQLYTREQEE